MNTIESSIIAGDLLQRGELKSVAEANVYMIRLEGVRVVSGRLSKDVRKALNFAVKTGRLGRLAKEGVKPECYFHPNSNWNAMELREREANAAIRAIMSICK